jgi:hypothetical protein
MYLKLRILFTVLSAICLVFILPALAWGGLLYLGLLGGGAFMFYLAMLICKQKQEELDPSSIIDNKEESSMKIEEKEEQ